MGLSFARCSFDQIVLSNAHMRTALHRTQASVIVSHASLNYSWTTTSSHLVAAKPHQLVVGGKSYPAQLTEELETS